MNLRNSICGAVLALTCLGATAQQQDGDTPAVAGMGRMVRGTITATAGDKLTMKTESGDVYQIAITPNTRLTKGRDPIKLADIHIGDGAGAMGEIDQPRKTVHAIFVGVVDAEQIKQAREAMGKSYISGKVTAIDELKLTILRSDGVSQVIAVDEDTSFRKGMRGNALGLSGGPGFGATRNPSAQATPTITGGESITLADIKVGDNVAGPGSLKNGVFVPTQLGVGEPGQGGGRRRRPADGTGAPASSPSSQAPAPPSGAR